MFRIDDPTAAGALPTPEAAGTPGYFTEGNPGVVQPTLVRASWLNRIQEEIMAIVMAAGLTPSKATYDQLLTALRSAGVFQTPPQFDASTKAATTAFVQANGLKGRVSAYNSSAVLPNTVFGGLIYNWGAGANTLTLPLPSPAATGSVIKFVNRASASLTVQSGGVNDINVGTVLITSILVGVGDTLELFTDGNAWFVSGGSAQLPYASAIPGRLINVQLIAANGTYTPMSGMVTCIAEAVAGGGGGGGSTATGAGQYSFAGGGASGAYGKGRYTAAQIGASQAVTIGSAGAGGAAGGGNGGAGGTTSLGSLLSCLGGNGGAGTGATVSGAFAAMGGQPAVSTGGNILNSRGVPGGIGIANAASGEGGGSGIAGGTGGGSPATSAGNGVAGAVAGAGGSGAASFVSDVARAGGAGAAGMIIVWEYA